MTEQKPKHKMEFVLGSFLDTNNGNQFTFFEEAMHQFVKQLPKALEDIEQGREPDNVFTIATNAYTKVAILKQKEGAEAQNKVLARRGIVPNMTPEQKKMKNEIIYGGPNIVSGTLKGKYGVLNDLFKGVPIDPNLKLTEVRAMYDPLQYSSKFNADVKAQKAEHSGSLGENLVSGSGNRRTFAINQAHTLVFFRENELKRIEKSAASLEKLKK